MTDRELLELAAKAADYPIRGWSGNVLLLECDVSKPAPQIYCPTPWSSLTNDGDAQRIRNKLRMDVLYTDQGVNVAHNDVLLAFEPWGMDDFETERRAMTRAAAEIQLVKEGK